MKTTMKKLATGFCFLILTLALSLGLAACGSAETNMVNATAMASVKRLAIARFSATSRIVLMQASTEKSGDAFGATLVPLIMQADKQIFSDKLSQRRVFTMFGTLGNNFTEGDTKYATAIQNPSSNPTVIAEIAKLSTVDGLLWLTREYRIRLTLSALGDKEREWTGEVKSQAVIYDSTGQKILDVTWVDSSSDVKKGASLSGENALPLLANATERAADTTVTILANTAAGQGLPQGLQAERTEIDQERIDTLAEMGICLRGFLVIALFGIGAALMGAESESRRRKVLQVILGLVPIAIAVYLLFGRGWWKDTILAILQFIKEAIFG